MSFQADVAQAVGVNNAPYPLFGDGITADAVQSGQIAVQLADGRLTFGCDPSLPGAKLRPISQGSDIVLGLQSDPTIFALRTQGRIAGAVLASGNFVLTWAEKDSPYNAKFCIFDPHGIPQFGGAKLIGTSSAAGGGGLPLMSVAALINGNFVVCYNQAGRLMFAIYDQSGEQVKAPTAVGAASTIYAISVASLAGGAFAVCYNAFSANEVPMFAVFSASGIQVLAPTQLRAAPASNTASVASAICALASGGFVCAYSINIGGSITNYFKRFDASGVLQGAETVIRAGAALNSGVVMRPITSGGFAIVETADVRLNVYNSSGILQGVVASRDAGFTQNNIAIATHPTLDGGLVVWQTSTAGTIKAMAYNSAGDINLGASPVSVTASSSGQVLALIDGASNCVVAWSDTTAKLAVATYSRDMAPLGSVVYPTIPADLMAAPLAGSAAYLASPLNPSAATFVLSLPTASGNAVFGIINGFVPRVTPVGVFSSSTVAAGANVQYQWAGSAALRTGFVRQFSCDIFPSGQKLVVMGKSAYMYGVA